MRELLLFAPEVWVAWLESVALPKHQLDDLLAQPVGAFVTGSVQFGRHRRHPGLRLGWPRLRRRRTVLLPAGGNISVDLTGFERGQIVL